MPGADLHPMLLTQSLSPRMLSSLLLKRARALDEQASPPQRITIMSLGSLRDVDVVSFLTATIATEVYGAIIRRYPRGLFHERRV